MDSWVKKYLIEEISANYDGPKTSQYFYKYHESVSDKLYAGPVWDYDLSFGFTSHSLEQYSGNPKSFLVNQRNIAPIIYDTWYSALYSHEDFYAAVVAEYEKTFLPMLQHLIAYKVDDYLQGISDAYAADSIRWSAAQEQTPFDTLEANASYLKHYITDRMDFLSSVWIDGTAYHTVTGYVETEANNLFFSVKHDEQLTNLPNLYQAGHTFQGWYYVSDDTPFDKNKPITNDTEIYAKWQADQTTQTTAFSFIGRRYRYIPIVVIFFTGSALFAFLIFRNRKYRLERGGHSK